MGQIVVSGSHVAKPYFFDYYANEVRTSEILSKRLSESGFFAVAEFETVRLTIVYGTEFGDKPVDVKLVRNWKELWFTISLEARVLRKLERLQILKVMTSISASGLLRIAKKYRLPLSELEAILFEFGEPFPQDEKGNRIEVDGLPDMPEPPVDATNERALTMYRSLSA